MEFLRHKPDARAFEGDRVPDEPTLISDGYLVARTVSGGDQALFRSLKARRSSRDPVRLTAGPDAFLLSLVPEDGRIEVEAGAIEADPGRRGPKMHLRAIGTAEPFGWTRLRQLRLLHALVGGWDRLYLRPGRDVLGAWKGGHLVGAVLRAFTDEDRAIAEASEGDVVFSIPANGDPLRGRTQKLEAPSVRGVASKIPLDQAIRRGEAVDPRAARLLPIASIEAMRPKLPIAVTYQLLGHTRNGHFSAIGILGPTGPLHVQELRAIPGHAPIPAAARFNDGPPVPWAALRAAWPDAPKTLDAATPLAVDATTEAPVPWAEGLRWLEGDDPVEAFLANDLLPLATILRGQNRAWHAAHGLQEGLFAHWLLRYEAWLAAEFAAKPDGWSLRPGPVPGVDHLPERLEGARAWPLTTPERPQPAGDWFSALVAAYGGEPPVVSFRRLRSKLEGLSLLGLGPELLAACARGVSVDAGVGRLVLRAKLGNALRPLPLRALRDAFPIGTILRLFPVQPEVSAKLRRAAPQDEGFGPPKPYPGLVEIDLVGSSPDLIWYEHEFTLPTLLPMRTSAPRGAVGREALEQALLALGAPETTAGPTVLAVPIALLAPRDPRTARAWLGPKRYRASYERITDTRTGSMLRGQGHDPRQLVRFRDDLNRASGLADAYATPKRQR